MAYTSDEIKKEYHNMTDLKRNKNLKKLRENIANLSLSEFSRQIGFTKNDLSLLENGNKTLTLFHTHAYKKYFLDNHKLNISVDYLMGYTDIIENNNLNFQEKIGLSRVALENISVIKNNPNEIKVLNLLLSDIEKFSSLLSNLGFLLFKYKWDTCSISAVSLDGNCETSCINWSDNDILLFRFSANDKESTFAIGDEMIRKHFETNVQEIIESYVIEYAIKDGD